MEKKTIYLRDEKYNWKEFQYEKLQELKHGMRNPVNTIL